jgi:hypothetical protein
MCLAAARCPEVQRSPPARSALAALQIAAAGAEAALAKKTSLVTARLAVEQELRAGVAMVIASLRSYEAAVDAVADGDARVINAAGLLSSDDGPPTQPVPQRIAGVRGRPGDRPAEAVLSWKPMRGAAGYAIRVNPTPDDPEGEWTVFPTHGRRPYQTVVAPAPGTRFLARVAALGRDGLCAGWSDPILVTTR